MLGLAQGSLQPVLANTEPRIQQWFIVAVLLLPALSHTLMLLRIPVQFLLCVFREAGRGTRCTRVVHPVSSVSTFQYSSCIWCVYPPLCSRLQ